ncbi:MAG: hypothetical protein JNM65_13045 [Verrucomicrobiaceae bacterium]|nr:hypothetical protein [Verrucomicrobiaceae bacterium]
MSSLSRLDQELLEKFNFGERLHAPSPLHRRACGTRLGQPSPSPLVVSWAHHATPLSRESVERQRSVAGRMQNSSSPLLATVSEHQFEPEYHWMSAFLPPGRDLRDILRVQQRLTVEQVEWLVAMLGEALRAAVDQGWPRLTLDATQVMTDFDSRVMTVLIPDMPLLGMSSGVQSDAMQTIAFNPAAFATSDGDPFPDNTRDYVTPLATLCTQLLGAAASGGGQNERFRAIPSLTIYQNTLLRSALAGTQRHSFETLDEFVSHFLGGGESGHATGAHTAHVTTNTPVTGYRTSHVPAAPATSTAASTTITRRHPAPVDATLLLAAPEGYTIRRELRVREGWRMTEAVHATLGDVVLTAVDVSAEVGEALRRLSGQMQVLQKSTRPELLRPVDVRNDPRILHVARPLPSGRTLLDALRERRAFPRPAVARLLAIIHASYEALWSLLERRYMATSLDQFWLPSTSGEADENGLLLDAPQLVIESVISGAQSTPRVVGHFARLAMLLLGQDVGGLSGEGQARFTPVPELSAEINGMLRLALSHEQSGDLTLPRFLAQLTAALAGHTAVAEASRQVLQVPEDLRGMEVKPAQRLRLKPLANSQPFIALIADESLWLGRASTHSDYVAQFRPHSPVNDSRTRLISRAQTRVFMQNGQVFLADTGTTNPSFTAGHRLGSPEIAELPMTLVLAGEYPLEMRSMKSAYPAPGPVVTGWPASKHRSLRRGACAFFSLDRGTLPFEAAWLFTDASLGIDSNGRLAFLVQNTQDSIVRFHHHAGMFWVEAPIPSTVELNGRHLHFREVAPLNPGDELRLQGLAFRVEAYTLESKAE